MTKQKLVGVDMRTEKDRKGRSIDVLVTRPVDRPPACKECGKEPRQQGSSRCKKCVDAYILQLGIKRRLDQKISNQLTK